MGIAGSVFGIDQVADHQIGELAWQRCRGGR